MAIIGIDLGTSNSAAAVLRDKRPVIIPSAEGTTIGGKAFPSYVAVAENGQILVGEPARRQAPTNPEGTATGFKRKMGSGERLQLRGREFSPEQLSAFLLQKIKRDAEAFLGATVDKAVVTVPAYFNDNQRNATKDACAIAGIEPLRLINEPTAAALAYGIDRMADEAIIAVIDLGGGTLDVTIMEFGNGVFEVKATSGDTQLGGRDMDERIFDFLAERLLQQSGVDIRRDVEHRMAAVRLREAGELAKIELSNLTHTRISLPFLAQRGGQPVHFETEMTRTELERLVTPVIERCRGPVEQALRDVNKRADEIDRILFVGGPTRMPVVRDFFEKLFGRKAESSVDPMEAVASGAAIQAGVLAGEVRDVVLVDVTPLTLGVETMGGVMTRLIERNTPIPVKKSETFTTATDGQTSVTVHVLQGERPMAADNISLGTFNLDGIAPAPRGVPKVEVTFDIDSSGVLDATARDTATGKSHSIRVTGTTRLSDAEKERMIRDAERYADEDRRRRERVERLNEADAVAYEGERFLREHGERIAADMRERIQRAIDEVKEPIAARDVDRASERAASLRELLQEAGKAIYEQQRATPGNGGDGGEPPPEGNGPGRVVDADYRDTHP